MNEIKFRAWDKDYKYMNHKVMIGNVWDEDNYHAHMIWIDAKDVDYERESGWMNFDEHSNIELMQYTGLKDKDGADIYEGDILKVFVLDSKGPHAKVKLKNGIFGIEDDMFGYGFYKGHYSLHQILSRYDAEVIGNIYENPELMEDK